MAEEGGSTWSGGKAIQTDPKPQAFHHQSLYYLNSDIVCKVCVAFRILYIISWTCLHVHYNDDWFSIAQSQPSASAPISQDSSPSARSRCPKGTTFSSSPSSSLSSLPSLHPFPKATRGPSSIPSLNLGGASCLSLSGKSKYSYAMVAIDPGAISQTATCAQVFWDPPGGGRPVQHRPRPARSSGGTRGRAGKRSLCRTWTWGWTCQRLPRAGTRAKNQEPAESRAGTWGGKFEKSSRAGTRSPGQSGSRARAEEPKIPFGVSSGTGAWRKLPWAWTRAWRCSKGENFEGKSGSSTRGNVERPKQQSLLYRLLNVFCYSLCTSVQLGPNVQRGINVEMTTTCKLCFLWVDKNLFTTRAPPMRSPTTPRWTRTASLWSGLLQVPWRERSSSR